MKTVSPEIIDALVLGSDSALVEFLRVTYDSPRPSLIPHDSYSQRRRQREQEQGEGFTKEEFIALCERYGNKCLKCGSTADLLPDHITPMVRGGKHHISNIQPLCNPCNFRKGITIADYRP